MEPGRHVVWLSDVAVQCTVAGDNPRVVSVAAGDTTSTSFDVSCNAAVEAHFKLDKTAVCVVPGGSEIIKVRAVSESGTTESWTATSSDESLVTVTEFDSILAVTGVDLGSAAITLSSASGLSREIPVRVCDPMVLDVGELTLAFVSQFECR